MVCFSSVTSPKLLMLFFWMVKEKSNAAFMPTVM